MSTEGGTKAIIAALAANLGIAIIKFFAFLLTGASSMLAEAVHSLADSGNQALLLIGGKRARRAATPEHPARNGGHIPLQHPYMAHTEPSTGDMRAGLSVTIRQ
jgi:hypothetical protein